MNLTLKLTAPIPRAGKPDLTEIVFREPRAGDVFALKVLPFRTLMPMTDDDSQARMEIIQNNELMAKWATQLSSVHEEDLAALSLGQWNQVCQWLIKELSEIEGQTTSDSPKN